MFVGIDLKALDRIHAEHEAKEQGTFRSAIVRVRGAVPGDAQRILLALAKNNEVRTPSQPGDKRYEEFREWAGRGWYFCCGKECWFAVQVKDCTMVFGGYVDWYGPFMKTFGPGRFALDKKEDVSKLRPKKK